MQHYPGTRISAHFFILGEGYFWYCLGGQQYISSILFDGNIPVCLYLTQRTIILINRGVKMNTKLLSALAEPNSPWENMQNDFRFGIHWHPNI